jgi:ABC-type antimicrobial peptide transport system permease subunit
MTRSFLTTFALCLSVLVAITVGAAVAKDQKAKQGQVNGSVHMINKDTSTITVMKGNVQRQVIYNNDTKWAYGVQSSAKASSLDQLKEGWYINCKGTFDGVKLVASACRFREAK